MDKLTIAELAEHYGTLDLLTAYIMRTAGVTEEQASDVVCEVDFDTERWLEELFEEDEEEDECETDM